MKEHPDFKGRDIRAVENPYEAAFELAATAGAFSRRTLMWLFVLAFFFIFYMALTVFVIYLNLYVFNQSDLKYLGLAMALVNFGMGVMSLWRIASSMRSFRLIGRNHALLQKLDSASPGKPAGTLDAQPSAGSRPQSAVNGLIDSVIADSRELLAKFRSVFLFIALWMVNAVVYFTIQSVRFGPNILGWTLDWIGPGGFGGDAFFFLAVSIIAYFKARNRFDFLRARSQAIEYAMGRPRAGVPAGATSLDRFKAHLGALEQYRSATGWNPAANFDGVLETPAGKLLVKALDATPDTEMLAEFVRHARAQGDNVRHAVLLYPEDPDKPLTDTVYNEVVNNPVRAGSELFTVELVMEGRDGFYDFIPVVPP